MWTCMLIDCYENKRMHTKINTTYNSETSQRPTGNIHCIEMIHSSVYKYQPSLSIDLSILMGV
jgi:hypothetical protein